MLTTSETPACWSGMNHEQSKRPGKCELSGPFSIWKWPQMQAASTHSQTHWHSDSVGQLQDLHHLAEVDFLWCL
jgi:hypothetical protein